MPVPAGYTKLPFAVRCRCPKLYQQGDEFYCCTPGGQREEIGWEVRCEGCIEADDFETLQEAKEFLDALDDKVLDIELIEVKRRVLETRNNRK